MIGVLSARDYSAANDLCGGYTTRITRLSGKGRKRSLTLTSLQRLLNGEVEDYRDRVQRLWRAEGEEALMSLEKSWEKQRKFRSKVEKNGGIFTQENRNVSGRRGGKPLAVRVKVRVKKDQPRLSCE